MTLEIQVLAWDRHNNVVGLNHLMTSHPPLLISESPMSICKNINKPAQKACILLQILITTKTWIVQ
jgi:hypothetical protein